MAPTPRLYGLDIETDTADGGLDPDRARVLAVAVSSEAGEVVLVDDDEASLLHRLDEHLAELAPGVLATWFGSQFDLPFLAERARRADVPVGLRLTPDPRQSSRPRSPGPAGVWAGAWHHHTHLDVHRLWSNVRTALGVSASLKSVAAMVGIDGLVTEDASAVHTLDPDRLAAYVASDARAARLLADRAWDRADMAIDAAVTGVGAA